VGVDQELYSPDFTDVEINWDHLLEDGRELFYQEQRSNTWLGVAFFHGKAMFRRRRHQPRRPALANRRPGNPAPAMGPGTGSVSR
jgi:hypothetical protein